ncbi:MAG: biotin/lipoyl-containing protein, partial [Bacteroidota bacterium]
MAEVVYMPKLSDTMTEGVVATWNKKVGDAVKAGEILAEIETDKATMEFESFYDGTLLHIGVDTGKAAPVNSVLAIIGAPGEDVSALLSGGSAPAIAETAPSPEPIKSEPVAQTTVTPPVVETPKSEPVKQPLVQSNSERVFASPLAKKLAHEKGVDIQSIAGTGENGRIVKRDVDHYVPYTPAARSFSPISAGVESFHDEPVSQMRKTIARRLAESKFTAPHFYLTLDIDMDNAIAARKSLNAMEGVKVSFND